MSHHFEPDKVAEAKQEIEGSGLRSPKLDKAVEHLEAALPAQEPKGAPRKKKRAKKKKGA